MTSRLLNGTNIAKTIRQDVAIQVQQLSSEYGFQPGLTVILVGNDPASTLYVKLKQRDCLKAGIACEVLELPESIDQDELISIIEKLNNSKEIHGILLQLPLPKHLNPSQIVERIDPAKDVDGITPLNLGKLALREPGHRCCTPKGVITLLEHTEVNLLGLNAAVVGASNHVGRPMCLELLMRGCTVTVAHQYSNEPWLQTRHADVLVTATGVAGLIQKHWIKEGAIVIDVGIETQPDGTLRGDVAFDEVAPLTSWITPVPGGVGPMTRVSILQNLLDSYKAANS